jgi:hypothetical protein
MAIRKLYRENRRINRKIKRDNYENWFRRVFLGNLIRWTFWNDKNKLVYHIIKFKDIDLREGVIIIMKNNNF